MDKASKPQHAQIPKQFPGSASHPSLPQQNLPPMHKTGTEISSRGNLFPSNATNQVALVPIGTVNGNLEVGAYSNYAILTRKIVNP
jgi:hypothetical protein